MAQWGDVRLGRYGMPPRIAPMLTLGTTRPHTDSKVCDASYWRAQSSIFSMTRTIFTIAFGCWRMLSGRNERGVYMLRPGTTTLKEQSPQAIQDSPKSVVAATRA